MDVLQAHQLFGVIDGQIAEKEDVDGGEDEGVRANAEGEQQDDDGGEGGVAGQGAEGKAEGAH